MNPLEPQQLITDESRTARQLRAGFPWLKFEHELEREFRREQTRTRLPQIRFNLYLGVALVVAVGWLNSVLLGRGPLTAFDVVQFGLLLLIVAGAIAVTHVPNGRRLYPRVAPLFAPMAGLTVIAVELNAAQGVVFGANVASGAGVPAPITCSDPSPSATPLTP